MESRKVLVDKIISELNSRGGYDDLWHNIDESIQEEIKQSLVNILPESIDTVNIDVNIKDVISNIVESSKLENLFGTEQDKKD